LLLTKLLAEEKKVFSRGEQLYVRLLAERLLHMGCYPDLLNWHNVDAPKEITSKSGTHFDPNVVTAFVQEAAQFLIISEEYKDQSQNGTQVFLGV